MRKYDFIKSRLTQEDRDLQVNYLRIQGFTEQIKRSKSLTPQQRGELWKQARDGDLDGAMLEYAKLVTIRGVEVK